MPRHEVEQFAGLMERKLAKHDKDRGPTGWKTADRYSLFRWMEEEVDELRKILAVAPAAIIGFEAADVANFAMMIADVCGAFKQPWVGATLSQTTNPFADAVAVDLARARDGHAKLNSAHEAYSVILEELDEFWMEVRKKRDERDLAAMLAELVQIGAMAQRAAEDLGLLP